MLMDTTQATPDSTTSTRRLKPYQISIAFGVGIGVFTMVSGIIPQITGWEGESKIHRKYGRSNGSVHG